MSHRLYIISVSIYHRIFIKLLGSLLGILLYTSLGAQTYPVQANLNILPPYSPYLSHYTSATSNSLQLMINVLELDRRDLRVKLKLTIEGTGIRIYTNPGYQPPPIVLQGGVPDMRTGFDLRSYFNADHLIFEGITKAEFIKGGKLPEGFYTFTIAVVEYTRNVTVSNQATAMAWMVLNDPPLINFPFNGDKLQATMPQNINFSWIGRHLASPNSAFTTEYEFALYEMYPGQDNPEVAVRSSNSLYRTTTTQTSLYFGPIEPQLILGKKYAFRIRAYDISGQDLFKNQGYSETYWFQYGEACTPVTGVSAEVLDANRIKLTWTGAMNHTGFTVKVREQGKDYWDTFNTLSTSQIIPDLKANTTYEYAVLGKCNQFESDPTTSQTIKTSEASATTEDSYTCGATIELPPLSPNPLQKPLNPKDHFRIGDLEVVVLEVTQNPASSAGGSGGSYSGTGYTNIPMFNNAGIRVKIQNVQLNEDYRALSGRVVTVYDLENGLISRKKEEEDKLDETPTSGNPDTPNPNELPAPIVLTADIAELTLNEAGELEAKDADGNTVAVDLPALPEEGLPAGKAGKTLVIEDAGGEQWTVDSKGGITKGAGGANSDVTPPEAVAQDEPLDYTIAFAPDPNQTYGFDASKYDQSRAQKLNETDYWVAWKSIASGRTDYAIASTDKEKFPAYIGFKTPIAPLRAQQGDKENTKRVSIIRHHPWSYPATESLRHTKRRKRRRR